jgi:hypothetical protein
MVNKYYRMKVAWKVVAQARLSQGSRIAFVLNTNEARNEERSKNLLIGVKLRVSQKIRMSKLGPGLRAFDLVTQKFGRTPCSYAGGETRRDLASGSREALAEA